MKQQLLNHLLDAEQKLVIDGIRAQFPVMRGHAEGPGGKFTTRLAQTVRIGKHELELVFDQTALHVRLEEPRPRIDLSRQRSVSTEPPGANWNWVWWVVAGGGLLVVLQILSQR